MSAHSHERTERLIYRLFTEGLRAAAQRRLREGLAECPACATVYRRFLTLEAGLCRTLPEPAPAALDRLEATILDAATRLPGAQVRRRPAGRRIWTFGFAGVFASTALATVLLWPGPRPDRQLVSLSPGTHLAPVGLTAKGDRPGACADTSVRVLRATSNESVVDDSAGLSVNDVVTFAYTNTKAGHRYLALFGIQAGGTVRWYYPGYDGDESVAIKTDAIDEPLGDGISLAVNHKVGWLRLVAVFSPTPVATRHIEAAVRLAAENNALEEPSPLPLPMEQSQCSMLVTLRPSR